MPPTANIRAVAPRRVLVVEDDSAFARLIQMLLNVDGHDVSIAKGGEKALAMFEAGEFDLVITGFDMPSMNGLEFAHAIRALSPRQPIVLLSSHIDPIQDKKVVLSNVNLVLEKPFSIAQLREAVARVFPAREGK